MPSRRNSSTALHDDAEYEKKQRDAWTKLIVPLSSELHRQEQNLSLGMHRVNALIITAIIAYADFDDPVFVVLFVIGMYCVVAIDLYDHHGLKWCIAAQVLFMVVLVRVVYTAVLVNQTEKYALQFHAQERALKTLGELGPNSTSMDAQPRQPQVNSGSTEKTLSNLRNFKNTRNSVLRRVAPDFSGTKVNLNLNRDLLYLMSEASLLFEEFTLDVLQPLLQVT